MNTIHFPTTPEYDAMSDLDKDIELYSDLYKDRNGFRPSLDAFRKMNAEERSAEIDRVAEQEDLT